MKTVIDDRWDLKSLEKAKFINESMVFVSVFLYVNLCHGIQTTFHRMVLRTPYLQS